VVDSPAPRALNRDSTPPHAGSGARQLLARVRYALPEGRTLPPAVWSQRHRTLLAVLWLHVVALPAFGVAQGYGVLHSLQEGAVIAAIAGLALLAGSRRRLASALVAVGLVSSSAILVHLSEGVIEAHFHFFVVIVLLTLYEDWLPLLLAAAYVVLHHGLTGALAPDSVYNHAGAIEHPWRWAAIHAGFVTAAGVASVATWRLNEAVRTETREAYQRAHQSEQLFKGAFEEAPIGMALTSVDAGDAGRFVQVNRAMCELLGYSEDELLSMSFGDISHPEDLDESVDSFRRILAGEITDYELEKRYLRADGRTVWGLVHVSIVRDSSGDPLYAIGQVQNVTERKAAEQRLTQQALEDQLTGLPNRRALMADLESVLAAKSPREAQLLLFDLDGFKPYNDNFGHPAGDALLRRLGQSLQRAVQDRGRAYRMGGDEFCVLAPVGPERPEALAETAVAALTEHGDSFTITASHGSVLLPTEASRPADALRMADQSMYARKSATRASAQDEIAWALTRVIDERSPELGLHVTDVTELCEAVGRRLGLSSGNLMGLRQAAALHDIGKIALPDAILKKPGPLSPDEWKFMRRHTLIGERIVGAAPAMEYVAKLIRSSHERYDGGGYPDGLAGDDIALGSRIIAVCDAYDAMTSPRPYRDRLSPADALAEIRRCAGTQFDPLVVDAFCTVWQRLHEPIKSA
jgi:PAS domain S-box-containing protein/diguanylate cyclase (GGDEF)-like protein